MRILYLTNGFPYPLTSGYLRHYFFIQELASRHSITLASLVNQGFAPEHRAALEPFTERVLTFPLASSSGSLLRKAVKGAQTWTNRLPGVRNLQQAVEQLVREQSFDVVLFSGKHTLPALENLGDLPVVADICDTASVRFQGSMKYASLLRRPWLQLGCAFMRRVERRLMSRATHLVFASCRDREALLSGQPRPASVVPNGVDLDYWKRSSPQRGTGTIVFTGAMHYPPNVDAALYLIQEILPVVHQTVPDAQLWIVGRDPARRLREARRCPGVRITGFVDDVRPYLEQATVFAAPLRFGAGIQNKVLEAMSMEVPVVASPVAAEGLRTEEGLQPPIQVAEGARPLAERIVEQLRSHSQVPEATARQYVASNFVWQQSGRKLEQVLQAVADGAGESKHSGQETHPLLHR